METSALIISWSYFPLKVTFFFFKWKKIFLKYYDLITLSYNFVLIWLLNLKAVYFFYYSGFFFFNFFVSRIRRPMFKFVDGLSLTLFISFVRSLLSLLIWLVGWLVGWFCGISTIVGLFNMLKSVSFLFFIFQQLYGFTNVFTKPHQHRPRGNSNF